MPVNGVRVISFVISRQISRSRLHIGQIIQVCHSSSGVVQENMDEEKSHQEVKEGKAHIILPKSVFYNPVQEFNRDLTIAVITQYVKDKFGSQNAGDNTNKTKENDTVDNTNNTTTDNQQTSAEEGVKEAEEFDIFKEMMPGKSHENGIRILEGLSASGLRSVRFGLEIPGVKEIIANDFDQTAVEFIEKNIERNKLQGLVKSNYGDAAMVMYQNKDHRKRFDVIDLDPYGSPSQFLDAAVQAVKDDGLLCITCTDMAVLCGIAGETCYSKYRAMSLKEQYCHEMALRIVLQCIEAHANRYSRYTEPLLAVSADFYIRLFIKVHTGQGKVKRSVSKMATVYSCVGCGTYTLQPLGIAIPKRDCNFKYTPPSGPPVNIECEHCGSKHRVGGPIWAESMYNMDFIKRVIKGVQCDRLKTGPRIIGMLTLMTEELPDVPLYYILDQLSSLLRCNTIPSIKFRSALLNAGYRVSMSHAAKTSAKTDAPMNVIWDIFRCWVKLHPVTQKRMIPGSVTERILSKEPTINVCFDEHPDANPKSRQDKLLRWQPNPEKDWGPKSLPKRGATADDNSQKKIRNQGKRKNKKSDQDDDAPKEKKYPCKYFKAGNCLHGDDCKFIHVHDENQTSQQSNSVEEDKMET